MVPPPPAGVLSHRLKLTAIVLCFFLSGATSLILETAWSKELTYLLGTDLYGTATTVVAYMGGLGFGAWLAARLYHRVTAPLKVYALLQGLIALFGFASIPLLRSMHPAFEALHGLSDSPHVFLLLRFAVTFGLLLPSTTLMGMTLPVVIGAYGTQGSGGGTTAGLLYGANTFGAVVGTLGAGLWLVPALGLMGTCFWAAGVDICIGGAALLLYQGEPQAALAVASRQRYRRTWLGKGVEIRLAYGIAGAVALGLELCWFRIMGQVIGPTAHALSVTLAVFLLGIALGSLLASPWVRRGASQARILGWLLLSTAILALLPLYYLESLPAFYQALWMKEGETGTPTALLVTQGIEACALMLPATLSMGATFPFAVSALAARTGETGDLAVSAAELFYINTFGAVLGTVLWGFVVIPDLGVHDALRAAAATCMFAGCIVILSGARFPLRGPAVFPVASALLAIIGVFLAVRAPSADPQVMNMGVHTSVRSARSENDIKRHVSRTAKLVFVQDGLNGTVAVVKNRYGRGELDLVYSGKWVATTEPSSRPHLHHLAHVPMLLARSEPRQALVIGMGSGITTGALLQYPGLERVDVVEIEPAVIEASSWFKEFNHAPLSDPRAHLALQDGRTFLGFSSRKYDVITSDPIHPWVKGAGNLYTLEYYRRAAERLNPGGIFAQWIPSSMSKYSFFTIVRTMKAAFPEVSLFYSGYEMIAVAGAEPVEARKEVFDRRTSSPEVEADLRSIGMGRGRFFSKLKSGLQPARVKADGQLNTDDNVFLEHRLPWDYFYNHNFILSARRAKTKNKH